MSLPNILTLARIAILPTLCLCLYTQSYWLALGLYVFCALTDLFDGILARKMDAITPFGTFLDPIADKIAVAVILVVLIDIDVISGWWSIPVLVIFTREFLISGLREFLGPKNVQMPVTKLAKWKTATQLLSLGFLIIAPALPEALMAGQLLLTLSAALTAITGWSYLKEGFKYMTS